MTECLSTWLQNLNLGEYEANFTENGYSSCKQCQTISKQELRQIGITKVGHLNRLFRAIEKLRTDAGLSQTADDNATPLVRTNSPMASAPPTEPLTPSSSLLSSSTTSTKHSGVPPPIPLRRSIRGKSHSPSPAPSPIPPDITPETTTTLQHNQSHMQTAIVAKVGASPPPVFPRQQSLKRVGNGLEMNLSGTILPSTLAKAGEPQLSPVPQSPMPGAMQCEPEYPTLHAQNGAAVMDNHSVEANSASVVKDTEQEVPPKLSPKMRRKHDSPSVSPIKGTNVCVPLEVGTEVGQLNGHLTGVGVPQGEGNYKTNAVVDVPAIPPKRKSKRVIIPEEDVEFELENVPMPPLQIDVKIVGIAGDDGLPTLPPKEIGVPSFTKECDVENSTADVSMIHVSPQVTSQSTTDSNVPPLPPRDSGTHYVAPPLPTRTVLLEEGPSVLEAPVAPPLPPRDAGPPDFAPPPPPRQVTPEPRVVIARGPPPPPPPRKSSSLKRVVDEKEVVDIPLLPPRDNGVPEFKPLMPPDSLNDLKTESDVPLILPYKELPPMVFSRPSPPPPLPPKEVQLPPPPPPITEEDFPQEERGFSVSEGDEEEEEGAPLMSIQSQSSHVVEDEIFIVAQSPENERERRSVSTDLSSPEPAPTVSLVWQQKTQEGTDDMVLFTSNPKTDVDYENQDVVDEAMLDKNQDYANQDAIDESIQIKGTAPIRDDAMLETNQDYANQDAIDESIQIKGTAPIRARTLERNTDKDYENQDVLDEDIIPFGTLPEPDTRTSPHSKPHSQEEIVHIALKPPARSQMFGGYEDVDRDYENTRDDVPNTDAALPTVPPKASTLGAVDASRSHAAPMGSAVDLTAGQLPPPTSTTLGSNPAPNRPIPKPRSKPTAAVVLTPVIFEEDLTPREKHSGSENTSNSTTPDSTPDSMYSSLVDTSHGPPPVPAPYGSNGDMTHIAPPVLEPYASSAPKFSAGEYFDGQAPLQRSLGTFAGIGCPKPAVYRKGISVDSLPENPSLTESISPLCSRVGSTSLQDVPRTKEGYLHKKGGKKSERPWQKRWVCFNGTELKYFKNKGDKESEALNIVKLGEMIDIKQVSDQDKQHRFDLVVINRVFQFYSESKDESEGWVNVLHAAISKFRPQDHAFVEGGNMHTPDKQGFLLKQGHGFSKGFKERYIALKGSKFAYYETKDDFVHGRPIHILEMILASVRPDTSGKCRFSITMNNQKSYVFQASCEQDRQEWLDKLTTAILTGLDSRQSTLSTGRLTRTKSSDILARIQANPANKMCADCSAADPSWGVINRGMMVCINCSGVHRAMGTHISKVRSIELDQHIWTDNLVKLMVTIGNNNANTFWEHHYHGERLPADMEREIRENFIRAKYQVRSWIPTHTGEGRENLSRLLCISVKTNNLMRTLELLVHGADPCYVLPDVQDLDTNHALGIAKAHNQDLQAELLEHNGALICDMDKGPSTTSLIGKKGHLYKTGSERTGWKRRYCSLDAYQGFKYFKSEADSELLGDIKPEEMLSVARCEEDSSRTQDPKYCHCFEVNTQGRGYLFCADSEEETVEWIKTFNEIISSDTAENLGFDKVGYLKKRDPHNVGGWKKRWFTLKGKILAYYRREREELAEIDLKKVLELKGPEQGGSLEQQCTFQIVLQERVFHLRADTPVEAESWISALKHTQVSGIPLSEQQLTNGGIPILVHKCLQFIESYGLEIEGLYRVSGVKAKIRKLILAFNQDARGVVIDTESYTVHDVTGTLKLFFRNLPDPLLTHHLYDALISCSQLDHETQLLQLQILIDKLPLVNRDTLRRVIGHLRKVIDHESKNKMGLSNLIRLFGPTLMTVDGDPVTFANTQFECACIYTMINHYKWLFQVDDEEEKKEEQIEKARKKIVEAEQEMKLMTMSSSTDFLTTIYIGNRQGVSLGMKITATTVVRDVVEKVATQKALPPANYALYLVLGDSESHRVLCFTELLLAALCSTGSDCFLCLRPNTFAETLQQYMGRGIEESVNLHVREKRKWKKYFCAVRGGHFIQFKDSKCHSEAFRLSVHDLDVFAGIERNKIDVKNPMPTRYCFWLKAMRGDDNCRYLCAETEQDMLKIMAAIVKAKYPGCLQTPVLPTCPPPSDFLEPHVKGVIMIAANSLPKKILVVKRRNLPRLRRHARLRLMRAGSPRASPRNSPMTTRKEYSDSDLKFSGKPR